MTLLEYESPAEREEDIRLVLAIPEDGDAPALVSALHRPVPPSRTGRAAEPLPELDASEGNGQTLERLC